MVNHLQRDLMHCQEHILSLSAKALAFVLHHAVAVSLTSCMNTVTQPFCDACMRISCRQRSSHQLISFCEIRSTFPSVNLAHNGLTEYSTETTDHAPGGTRKMSRACQGIVFFLALKV